MKRFTSAHCQCGVPWNKLTFSCSDLFSVSGRQSSSDAMRNRIVLIVEGRSRACVSWDCLGTCRIPYFCLSSCLLLSPSFCQNVPMLHKQCSDNTWAFQWLIFLSLWNNVFSDCVFLAYFPLLTNSQSYPSPMGSCIWPWSLCPSRLQN